MYMVPYHADFLNDIDDSLRNLLGGLYSPMPTDVIEMENSSKLIIDLPGFEKEKINIELEKGYLTITASMDKSSEETKENGKYIRKERHTGSYKRSFYVGENVNKEDIKAKFENGILTVTFPKNEERAEKEKKTINIE